MNNLRTILVLLITICFLNSFSQLELAQDSEHAISYEVRNDSVLIFIDVFNDTSIDLDSDGNLDASDDYVYLMFDLNSNGIIDLSGDVDILYTYDESQTNNICKRYILSPSAVGDCENSEGGYASVELKATSNNSTPHLFYTFSIPKAELDFLSNSALCGRISVKVHTAGTPTENAVTFPGQIDVYDYFVDPFNVVQLYPEAVITLPNGDVAPENISIAVCIGDTLRVSEEYPKHHWSGLSESHYQVVLNIPTDEYYFKITDPNNENCIFTDTVYVNLLDQNLCKGAYVFPNIVTPNSDNVNDVFKLIIGQDLLNQDWKGSKIRVFNRWGYLIFGPEVDDSFPIWYMRTEYGKLVTSGTYYYTYITPGDSPQRIHGFFTVLHSE